MPVVFPRKIWQLMLVLVALGCDLMAVDITWISSTTGSGLFTDSNWTGGVAPTSTQVGFFSSSTGGAATLSADGAIGGIKFTATAGPYVFSGSGAVLTIGSSGIENLSALSQYFTLPLTFAATNTVVAIRNDGAGALVLGSNNAPLTMANGTSLLFTGSGAGGSAVQGPISGAGSLTKEGSGSLKLTNASTYLGGTFVNQGTLSLLTNQALPAGGSVTVNANGGTAALLFNGTSQSFGQLTLGGTAATARSSNLVSLGSNGAGNLTLGGTAAGAINYLASSSTATDPAMAMIRGGTVTMANGGSINVSNSSKAAIDLYIDAALASTAAVTKTGAGVLMLNGSASGLTGNLVASAGTLLLGSTFAYSTSGSGAIEVQSGAILAGSNYSPSSSYTPTYLPDLNLNRAVTLRNGAQLGTWSFDQGKLVLSGAVTVDAGSTVKIGGDGGVQIAGGLDAAAAGAALTFANADPTLRSVVGVTSTVGTNVSTLTSTGAAVIFSVVPTATTLIAGTGGYIGIAPAYTGGTNPSVAGMVNQVGAAKSSFVGTFGFDSSNSYGIIKPTVYAEALDFSGFDSRMTLGSVTKAVLSGTITPADSTRYAFGNGGGVLAVTSNLTDGNVGPRALSVVSAGPATIEDNSLGVVLQGANTFSGNVTVDNSFLIFDSPNAFPAQTGQRIQLTTSTGAYLGTTEVSNVASFRRLGTFLGSSYSPLSVIGFDSHDYIAAQISGSTTSVDRVIREGINLAAYSPLYLGSGTRTTLSGTLVAPASGVQAGNRALYLAAMGDGRLTVRSFLNPVGMDQLVIGGASSLGMDGTVVLSGRNTFTGGTSLLSGALEIAGDSRFSGGNLIAGPLGTGTLTVPASALAPTLQGPANGAGYYYGALTFANPIALNSWLALGDPASTYGNAALRLTGPISGPGGLDIYSDSTLGGQTANTFSGGVRLTSGILTLGSNNALGTGDLVISSSGTGSLGLSVDGKRDIANNVTVESSGSNSPPILVNGAGSLNLKGSVTLMADTALAPQTYPLTLSGPVSGAGGLSNFGTAPLILSGTNSYSGNTISSSGPIIFSGLSYGNANFSGQFMAYSGGYIGVASPSFGNGGTYQNTFVDHFDKASTGGTLGFDSLPDAQGNLTVNTFAGPVDLSGFTSNVRLGSATQAVLSGTITPQGTAYRFGAGGGMLTVTSALTDQSATSGGGVRSLDVTSPYSVPLTLRLPGGGGNTFTGGVTVDNSAVIFGSASGAMPSSGSFSLSNFAYLGTEDTSLTGSNLSSYFNRIVAGSGGVVVGFDVPGGTTPTAWNGTIDLSSVTISAGSATSNLKDPAIFLGTATKAEIGSGATIVLPANQAAYRFTGYKGGELTVSTSLAGSMGVQIGDGSNLASMGNPTDPTAPLSTVILKGNNAYTGGTVLSAGQLLLGSNSALGTGALRVTSFSAYSPILSSYPVLAATAAAGTNGPSQWVVSNPVILDGPLALGGSNPFTLSGVISGTSQALIKTGSATVTLSGANTFDGGIKVGQGTLVLAGAQAAGLGLLTLTGSGSPVAQFTAGSSTVHGIGGDATGGVIQLAPSSTLVVSQPSDAEYAGAFSGSGALLRFQAGANAAPTVVLSGVSSSFTGTTAIDAGVRLQISNGGALGASEVMINGGKLFLERGVTLANPVAFDQTNGGSLAGNGTLARATTLTIGAHASLDPGRDLPGTLSLVGAQGLNGSVLSLAAGGTLRIKMSDALDSLGGWDQINVAGLTAFNVQSGLFTVKLSFVGGQGLASMLNFDASQTYAWPILSATSITGYSPNSVFVDVGGVTLPTGASMFTSLNATGDTLLLNYSPVTVPEPSTWALMLSGAAFLGYKLRRRRTS